MGSWDSLVLIGDRRGEEYWVTVDVFDPADPAAKATLTDLQSPISIWGHYLWAGHYFDGKDDFYVYDLNDWPDLEVIASFEEFEGSLIFGPEGGLCLLKLPDTLTFLDLDDPADIQILGTFDPQGSNSPGSIFNWDPDEDVLYSGQSDGTLMAIDYSDPQNPFLLDQITCPAEIRSLRAYSDELVVVYGRLSFYGERQFQVVSTQDPANLSLLSSIVDIPADGEIDLERSGDFLYVGRRSNGVDMYDLSDPAQPALVGNAAGTIRALYSAGQYLVSDGKVYLKDRMDAVPVPLPNLGSAVRLDRATPNPFNPRTSVDFFLDTDRRIDLGVYDLHGRRVQTLA